MQSITAERLRSKRNVPPDTSDVFVDSARLPEAVDIIRTLWKGETRRYRGEYYTVENARIYTLPAHLPPILMAAGGSGKLSYGQLTVCWARDEASARRIAYTYWPTAAVRGELTQELPTPAHFEQAARMVREDDVAEAILCGPDPERHIAGVKEFIDAGDDHVYVHQVGPDQQGFFRFYEQEVLPKLR